MADVKLPTWAKINETGKVVVDPDKCYPALLAEYKALYKNNPDLKVALTQYWGEVLYQSMKMDVQTAMGCFGKKLIEIKVLRSAKYKIANMPDPGGNGAFRATKGKEARDHYTRLRGTLPVDTSRPKGAHNPTPLDDSAAKKNGSEAGKETSV